MAECLEDLDFDFYNMKYTTTNNTNSTSVTIQLIDLAEKEGFNNLELSDINFPDGVPFNRLERLDKVKKIKISNTNISTLANLPSNMKELIIKKGEIYIANFILISLQVTNVSIINNKINKILYLNLLQNLVYLDLSQNNIKEIPLLPNNVKTFIATHNKIKQIQNLNKNLIELNLSNNLITEMANIPIEIESINISRNQIMIIDLSPFEQLKVFKAYNNQINLIIGPIASNIEVLDIFNNFVQQLPDIGLKIKEMDLSNNDLKVLPKFGTSVLERLDITKNPLLKVSDDEIVMLLDINRLNNSFIVICDQFDIPDDVKGNNMSSSSSSELDLSDIYANTDDNDIKQEPVMRHFDIIELLNRNRNRHKYQEDVTYIHSMNQQIHIIRGNEIHKRRIYEL